MSVIHVKTNKKEVFRPITINIEIVIETSEELESLRDEYKHGSLREGIIETDYDYIIPELLNKIKLIVCNE